MNDIDRIINAVYEFVLFELAEREQTFLSAESAFRQFRSQQNTFAVAQAWIELEYFRGLYQKLVEYLRYFT